MQRELEAARSEAARDATALQQAQEEKTRGSAALEKAQQHADEAESLAEELAACQSRLEHLKEEHTQAEEAALDAEDKIEVCPPPFLQPQQATLSFCWCLGKFYLLCMTDMMCDTSNSSFIWKRHVNDRVFQFLPHCSCVAALPAQRLYGLVTFLPTGIGGGCAQPPAAAPGRRQARTLPAAEAQGGAARAEAAQGSLRGRVPEGQLQEYRRLDSLPHTIAAMMETGLASNMHCPFTALYTEPMSN